MRGYVRGKGNRKHDVWLKSSRYSKAKDGRMSYTDYCFLETNGESISPGRWMIAEEKDDPFDDYTLIYYTNSKGIPMGTHLDDCKIIDPVYGQIYPHAS